MIDAKKIDRIMKEYKLHTVEGLIVMHCAYMSKDSEKNECAPYLSLVHTFLTQLEEKIKIESIQELIDKKIINPIKVIEKAEFLDFYPTDEFIDKYYIDSFTAGEELWRAYPNTTVIDGKTVPLKKGDKIGDTYVDKDFLIKYYSAKIGNDKDKHEEILVKVKKANEVGAINFTLRSFIFDEGWEWLDDLIGNPQLNNRVIL